MPVPVRLHFEIKHKKRGREAASRATPPALGSANPGENGSDSGAETLVILPGAAPVPLLLYRDFLRAVV